MNSKDSLIVQLSPEVRAQLNDSPRSVLDAVLKREALLQDQIQHFISLRVQELRNFSQHLLEEHVNELRRAQQDRKDALAARSRPPLKSIVKRRASSSSKRVSFSTVPPKIEYYPSGDEQSEQDSQALESSDEDVLSPPQLTSTQPTRSGLASAVVVYEPSPDKPKMRAGQDFEVHVRQISDQTLPSKPKTSGGYDFSKISSSQTESDTERDPPQVWSDDAEDETSVHNEDTHDCTIDKPALPVFPHRHSHHHKPWRAQRQRPSALLSFDDAIDDHSLSELDSESDETSGDITPHRPTSPSPPPQDSASNPPASLTVGSAPIDIHTPLTKALDGDGGPNNFKVPYQHVLPPAAEELEVSTPPKDPLSDPYLPPMELDPANLSFSQRMEWEDRFKTSLRPLNNSFTGKI